MRTDANRFTLVGVLLLCVSSFPVNSARAAKPLPADNAGPTTDEFYAEFYTYLLEDIALYGRLTKDPPPIRAQTEDFLKSAYARACGISQAKEWSEVRQLGDEVFKAGGRDPLFLSNYGFALHNDRDYSAALVQLEAAWAGMSETKYPPRVRMYVPLRAHSVMKRLTWIGDPRFHLWQKRAFDLAVEWLSTEKFEPKHLRFAWNDTQAILNLTLHTVPPVGDEERRAMHQSFYDRCKDHANIDPWLRAMISGEYHIKMAWYYRGGETADKVTEEGWKKFRENIGIAGGHLKTAIKLRPEFPEAPAKMITVAAVGGDEGTGARDWFDRAVAIQFDYMPAYEQLIWFMRPRWGGSHSAMYAFGRECAATKRYDTEVPYLLIDVLEAIDEDRADGGRAWGLGGVYPAAKRVLTAYSKEPARADDKTLVLRRTQVLNRLLLLAIQAEQHQDARRMLEQIDEKRAEEYEEYFEKARRNFPAERARIWARTGKAADLVEQIEEIRLQLSRSDKPEPELHDKLVDLATRAQKLDDDPHSALYYEQRLSIGVKQREFDAGKWVKLTFDKTLSDWTPMQGKWTVEDENTVVGDDLTTLKSLMLRHRLRIHGPIIVELDVEQLEQPREMYRSGVMVGNFLPEEYKKSPMFLFWVEQNLQHNRRKAGYALVGTPGFSVLPREPKQKSDHLKVKIAKHYFEYYINDIHGNTVEYHPRIQPGPIVALGTTLYFASHGRTRFSNVRIRKWTEGPPPPFEEFQKRIPYFEKVVAEEPNNARAWCLLGTALYYAASHEKDKQEMRKTFELAIDHLDKAKKLDSWQQVDLFKANALQNLGREREAAASYEIALKGQPTSQVIKKLYAGLLACAQDESVRDGKKALQLAQDSCKATQNKDASSLEVLAMAHAELGNFPEAVRWGEEALKAARDEKRREQISKLVKQFQENKPNRFEY